MSTPLVDIDANPRQPGFTPCRASSKIPSPPKLQQPHSSTHPNLFSVSMTGPPCYTATSATSKSVMSQAPISRLPRISTPMQSAFSQSYTYGSRPVTSRSSLPRARGGYRLTGIAAPSQCDTRKASSTLSCDKPLPSPPVVQIVNPASPPKARRTLVDAEAGTPTDEQWPILRPENAIPLHSQMLLADKNLGQRSISDGSSILRIDSDGVKSQQGTESRVFSSTNADVQSFHALSTNTDEALDSPLVCKQRASPGVIVPPRISSKRSSLLHPDVSAHAVHSQPLTASSQAVRSVSTKWPVLVSATDASPHESSEEGVLGNPQSRDVAKPTANEGLYDFHNRCVSEREGEKDLQNYQHHCLVAEPEPIEHGPSTATERSQSRYGSIDSISTWSLGTESFVNGEIEARKEGSFRVKRLSWHPSNTGSGPTLKIFADADAIILGRKNSVPAVPALPKQVLEDQIHTHPTSTSAERISNRMIVKMNPAVIPRTSTLSSSRTGLGEGKPVRISPIRSMQPPRELSSEDISQRATSTSTRASLDIPKETAGQETNPSKRQSPVETSQETTVLQPRSNVKPHVPADGRLYSESSNEHLAALQDETSTEHPQGPIAAVGTPQTAARKCVRVAEIISRSASSKSGVTRSRTSPFLPSSERLEAQVSRYASRSPSIASSRPGRSNSTQPGSRQLASNQTEVCVPVSKTQGPAASSHQSTKGDAGDAEQSAIDGTLEMTAKRSLRNIFRRRNPKATPRPDEKRDPKRSSAAGSALAQRFRESTNLSKISLLKPPVAGSVPKPDTMTSSSNVEPLGNKNCSRATTLAPDHSPAKSCSIPELATYEDTASVVHSILDRVTSLSEESPDRLRGLEIAEAILHTVENSKKAAMNAELARKHARDAELHALSASLELKQLARLCEADFDDRTMRSIKQLITKASCAKLSEINVEG